MWRSHKRKATFSPPYGKLEIFSRHCLFSTVSLHKKKLEGFSLEKCYQNLLSTIHPDQVNLTFFLDTAGKGGDHFIKKEKNVIEIQEGSEAGAFLALLEFIASLSFHDDTVLYLVEDDYLHRHGWVDILLEGIMLADYVTLYDHKDKYFSSYHSLQSKMFHTKSCHWRSTPSTTQTFAVRWKTLREDLSIHQKFSKNRQISQDHLKFLALSRRGRTLISSVPGFSTHAEQEFASPCFNWSEILCTPLSAN